VSISVYPRYAEEPIDSMLFRLKKLMKEDNRILDMRKHDFYIKPGEKKRLKRRRKKTVDGNNIRR